MSQLEEILDGWKNLLFKNKQAEEIAVKRLKICLDCTDYVKDKKKCGICRCYIPAKTRSETSLCPSKNGS